MALRDLGAATPDSVILDEIRKKLPSVDFVKNQTTLIGGEVLVVGLTAEQSSAIQSLAMMNGLTISESQLSAEEVVSFSKPERGFSNITTESKTLLLGTTYGCEKGLYKLLENL